MKLLNYFVPVLFATAVQAGLTEWQDAVNTDNPRNWYQFDETSGTTLVDHGSGGYDGEYMAVDINQTGLFGPGQAANFPGQPDPVNDLVQFGSDWADHTIAGDWTVEVIVNKSVENVSQALFNGPSTSVRLEQWNSFNVYGDYRGGVTQYGVADYYLEGTVAPVSEWSHMVFVRTGGRTLIYLNGVNRGAMDNVVDLQMQTISRSNTGGEADKLHAVLDEAVVYDYALSADRVAAHFATTGITPPAVPPTITGQPQSASVIIGTPDASVTFSVVATGTLPLEYQWMRDGVEITGATSDVLPLTNVTSADVGTYTVVVSNSGGSETSAEAVLSIDAPAFNEGNNQTVLNGFPATFSVTLPDVEGYTFEWSKDGTVIEGETGPSLMIDSTTPADSGAYSLAITIGADSATAGPAQLIVPAAPTTSYADTILGDTPTSFWRLGEGAGEFTLVDEMGLLYGTYFDATRLGQPGALLGDANTSAGFNGTTTSKGEVFQITDELSKPTFSIELWAKRTGGAGSFTSPLTYRDFSSDPAYRKGWTFYATSGNHWQFRIGDGSDTWVIIDGPAVNDGAWTHLVGTYDGTSMAFYVNGALVESRVATYAPVDVFGIPMRVAGGSTEDVDGAFFFIGQVDEVALYPDALTPEEVAGHYAAAFDPSVLPVIVQQPQSTEVVEGGSVTLTVQVSTGTPASYQWKKDGVDLAGETSPSLTLADADDTVAGTYSVEVVNAAGSATSDPATLAVVGPEASYVATILRDGPVAYWRLDESEGTVAADSAGSYDGTYVNGVTLGEPGALVGDDNTAARFTQANQTFVEVPWSANLNTPEFTFECWAKVTGGSGYRSPMTSRGDPPQEGYIFYATPNNNWEFWTGPGWDGVGGASVENDVWVYLAGTFDGTTKRYFVNGQEVGSSSPSYVPNDADVLRIGAGASESPTGNYFFEGVVDEAAVYNKALSAARILTHYQAGRPVVSQPVLGIALVGGDVVLNWEGTATLQQATDPTGPWTDVAAATSPHQVTPTEAQMYWRLMSP